MLCRKGLVKSSLKTPNNNIIHKPKLQAEGRVEVNHANVDGEEKNEKEGTTAATIAATASATAAAAAAQETEKKEKDNNKEQKKEVNLK